MTGVRLRGVILLISTLSVAVTLEAMWFEQWRVAIALYAIAVVGLLTILIYRTYRGPDTEPFKPAVIAAVAPFHPHAAPRPIPVTVSPVVVSNERRDRR